MVDQKDRENGDPGTNQGAGESPVTECASTQSREQGNTLFKGGDMEGAITCYLKSLQLSPSSEDIMAAHRNLALVYLKQNQHDLVVKSCDQVLAINPGDIKALFRRSQALENMDRIGDALKDALKVHHFEPTNQVIQPVLRRLNEKMHRKQREESSTVSRVKKMLQVAGDPKTDEETRKIATENLMVLAREETAAEMLLSMGGMDQLNSMMHQNKGHPDIVVSCIRVVSELCKNSSKRTLQLLPHLNKLVTLIHDGNNMDVVTSLQYTIQTALNSLSGVTVKEGKSSKPVTSSMQQHASHIDAIMSCLMVTCQRRAIAGATRDAILELIVKNVDVESLCWAEKVVSMGHIVGLLDIASELEDVRYESSMNITCNTRTHVSLALERVYANQNSDKYREQYRETVMSYLNERLLSPDIESKVRVVAIITTLLHGPIEVGNHALSQQGLLEMMLVMAGCDEDEVQQRVAADAIIAAASKKDKCTAIVGLGGNILKKLLNSSNDSIRIRGLVGLCKLGSVGGSDASLKPFNDESVSQLMAGCKKYLLKDGTTSDMKRMAAEGFAYLTLDANVKDDVTDDPDIIRGLIKLGQSGNLSCLYGVITTFVNLTNSYEKNEVMPEMLELAKFAKQHVPEQHIKDGPDFIDARVRKLANLNVASALTGLSTTESRSGRELICRVFNALCQHKEFRGGVVSCGGAKALLSMALDNNSPPGRLQAAQALARICITMNPEIAFPGQRCVEVVRPIKELLHVECSALQNFEAIMALTNLAQVSDAVMGRILADGGFSKIENYIYEDHELLRRSSTQAICNLCRHPDVLHAFEGDNDRVKMLTILMGEDDLETSKAASGALATMTSVSNIVVNKIFETKRWYEILIMVTASQDHQLMQRAVVLVRNMIYSDESVATRLAETTLLEVLMALTRPEVDDVSVQIKNSAMDALKELTRLNLIKKADPTVPVSTESADEPD